ncbi:MULTISPECIES: lipoprotein-releasing ABC transporter permease subunit [Oceanibaculum]|uniref:Lipoprotein-releasing system permease protein n=1 Tax=Oceanibaculum indicum TaxID=526216 RepID=A0A420WPP5_9PROT|nr:MULTISPECIES: lipoprotein-releasing ABC transporter permease subunit [Oceanibaculum]MCH2395602.1 lipoprotein-releasing ABC transporter permease subunit [Oceanibaculum sp.]RKQ72950.1 lipoprotein-releasing system permease protein [Oceanibaculum indicum]
MIFSAFERMVAFRYLRARRQEGFISVIAGFSLLGIALGVATLIIVMSVMNGFRAELLGRILGVNGHLTIFAQQGPLTGYAGMVDQVQLVEGVTMAFPQVEGQVMATANGVASGALVKGMRREDVQRRALLSNAIMAGSLDAFEGNDAVMIGTRMAQRMNLTVGNQITLISPQSNPTAFGSIPRLKSYTVAALFEVGMYEYDNSFIYMPMEAAQTFFRLGDAVTGIDILLDDPDAVRSLREAITTAIGPGKRLYDWQQANSSFFTAIQVERNVMFLILTLIILVAAFNIISSLIMLVKDKGRDIAVLRTMGASRGMIMRIFFMTGASIGVVGTLAGFVLGLLFCLNIETIRKGVEFLTGTELFSAEIYFLSRLPAKVDTSEVITVVLMALILSFLATIYPAWRAARQDPVEALRYE